MKERIYGTRLTENDSIPIEQTQTKFMSEVFELAKKSRLYGYGLDITRLNANEV